jgi:hypothetical protein
MTQPSESFGPNKHDINDPSASDTSPLDSLSLTPADAPTALRLKALLGIIEHHNNSIIPKPRSPQYKELRQGLIQLSQCERYIDGMGAICKILERHIDIKTLLTALDLVNQFYSFNPQRKESAQFKKLLIKQVANESLDSFAQLCAQFIPLYQGSANSRGLIHVLERSSAVLTRSNLADVGQEKLIELMGLLVAHNGSLRGIQSIRKALAKACSTQQVEFLASTITAAVLNDDSPRAAALALEKIPAFITQEPLAAQVLERAITAHKNSGGSTATLVQSFSDIFGLYEPAELEINLERYGQLVELLQPHCAPLHLLRRQDVETLIAINPSEYATRVALKLREIERLTEMARSSGKFDPNHTVTLQEILLANSSPEVFRAFELLLTQGVRLIENSEFLLARIEYFGSELQASVTEWRELYALVGQQIDRQRGLDDLIDHACQIKKQEGPLWANYIELAEKIAQDTRDLRFITPEVVQLYTKNPSEEQLAYLTTVMEAVDGLWRHTTGDEAQSSTLLRKVVRTDGVGDTLLKAIALHHRLGKPIDPLYRHYLQFVRTIPTNAGPILTRMVDYQETNNRSVEFLFRNFAELVGIAGTNRPAIAADHIWNGLQQILDTLTPRGVPVDFLNPACVQAFLHPRDTTDMLTRIERYLTTLYALSAAPANQSDPTSAATVLLKVADVGPNSPGPYVLQMLSTDEAGRETMSCVNLATGLSLPAYLSPEAWTALARAIEIYREHGWPLKRLVESTVTLDGNVLTLQGLNPGIWESVTELLSNLRDAELPYDLVTSGFILQYHKAGDPHRELLSHFLTGLTRFNLKLMKQAAEPPANPSFSTRGPDTTKLLRENLDEIIQDQHGLTDNPAMVHKLKLILAQGDISSFDDYRRMIDDLRLHALTDIMRNSADESRREWASEEIGQHFNMGGPPYVEGSAQAKQHFNESMKVVDPAFRDSKGFGGMAIDTRGVPRSRDLEPVPPMLVRFGLDSAEETYVVNSSSNNSFPGKGICISQIDIHKVFSTDPLWRQRGKQSPHWKWLENKGLFSRDPFYNFNLEDFSASNFLFLRGATAVIPSFSERAMLDGSLYSYLVYNRHFYPGVQVALGVPTVVLMELLGSALIPAADYRGFDPRRTDLSKVDLSFKALRTACEKRNLNILDLTYGSVIGGGLCNAYMPKSLPHYLWERDSSAQGWTDRWGHIHKSFRLGGYGWSMSAELDKRLQDARRLQQQVFDVVRPLQNHLDAFRFALSFYKMGTTLIGPHDFRKADSLRDQPENARQPQNQQEQEPQEHEEGDQAENTPRPPSGPPTHEYRYRMLEEAYRWHLGAREQGWSNAQYPVLYSAFVLDPSSLPPVEARRFELDLATMVLKTAAGVFHLPKDSDGKGEAERKIWREYVVPHFATGWEPRFLLRDGAFTIHE